MKTPNTKTEKWHSSADLVRITAMLMVVILHVARMSGFLDMSYEQDATAKWISNIWEAPTIIAVNLFAMLTGYLCVDKKWKVKRILSVWFQSAFYILLITACCCLMGKGFSVLELARSLFPLTSSYWYVIAYSALFVLIPFINRGIRSLSHRELLLLCTILVLTLSVFGFASTDALAARGHCVLWLGVMYICGAYIKLHCAQSNNSPKNVKCHQKSEQYIDFTHIIAFFVFVTCCLLGCLTLWVGDRCEELLFRHYQSPIVCLEAIACFLILIRLRIRSVKVSSILRFLSPMAFGVYLFHCGIWGSLSELLSQYAVQTHYPWWFIPVFSVAVYVLGTFIDYVRIKLFQLFRIPELCQFLASKLPTCIRQMEEW